MTGRVALITGAARGIGFGIAQALASAGSAIAIQDIDESAAREAAEKLKSAGARTIALGGDMTDPSAAEKLPQQVIDRLGGLHVLVNNASIQSQTDWLKTPLDQMERELRADLLVPILLAQKCVPIFQQQKWGRILNIGSIQQSTGNAGMLAYSLSKAAMEKMTMALARKHAREGITVNCIAPGYFDTLRNQKDRARMDQIAKQIPIQRVGQPSDCAGIALLLCSEAGAYITGQSIYVDGGLNISN